MIKAAIDIGTNTAHLLISVVAGGQITQHIYRKRYYVYLAEDGIDFISLAAQERLYEALNDFSTSLREHNCQEVFVSGTEALRKAKNGPEVADKIKSIIGHSPHIISGVEEATYIYRGVQQVCSLNQGSHVIVDIGGGSVEFIHIKDDIIQSIHSHPIGIANLYNRFHKTEPIRTAEIDQLYAHLDVIIGTYLGELRGQGTKLIGSAGTFEVFADKIANQQGGTHVEKVQTKDIENYYLNTKSLSMDERLNADHIPSSRAKYIVVAILLVKYLIDRLALSEMTVSRYALKEGIIVSDY